MPSPTRDCPLCAAPPPAVPWLRKGTLNLVRCPHCDLAFADPLPAEADDRHYDQLGRPYYLSPDKLAGDYASVRFERELRLFRRYCKGGEVLDVGCSTGAFLSRLNQRFPGNYRTAGIEISSAAIDYARDQGIEVIADSLLRHDFGGRRFDAVVFWAVLEHLPEPAAFIARITDLLRPGGHCLALVPNRESLAGRLLGPRYRYVLPQHVNYFTRRTLTRLLTDHGNLEAVANGGSHFNPIVLVQDWRRGTPGNVPDAERAALLARTTRLKQAAWLKPAKLLLAGLEMLLASLGLADNIWAVSRKAS